MASKRNGTLYGGVTSDLPRRSYEHKNDLIEGFTKKYRVHMLVHVEFYNTMEEAFTVKNALKNGNGNGSWN